MKIVICSGKGGVGKSMLASSLALLFSKDKNKKIVACDCDVDAPNLGIWLGITEYDKKEKISTSVKAIISQKKCIKCGKCLDVCRFFAVVVENGIFKINPLLCEGCGACKLVCNVNAIELNLVKNGEIMITETKYGFPLISAQLYPGESGSGKIVEEVKNRAENFEYDTVILDAAAGIGCPVIASVRGCDYAMLVTEPTPSGFSDLKRMLEIITHFNIPYGIVINKWNINPNLYEKIKKWSKNKFLGQISYDRKVVDAIVNLRPVIETDSVVVDEIKTLFKELKLKVF